MKVCVVIPCYKVKNHITNVINSIPNLVQKIYVIDDSCPEGSGLHAKMQNNDSRVEFIFHDSNLGVGGAVKTGYAKALQEGFDIAVKIDGDGQMDPLLISKFITPIIMKKADYTKGNRFYKLSYLKGMPGVRLFGNTVLSFISKLSTGNWKITDPTNGFTALRLKVSQYIDLDHIDNRYFFETDMLFQLGLINARIIDIPMEASYGSETSNLSVKKILFEFSWKHIRTFFKRILIKYFLRDINIGSIFLVVGTVCSIFSLFLGIPLWMHKAVYDIESLTGILVLFILSTLLGVQGLSCWMFYDVFSQAGNSVTDLLGE